jgi:hypothetical protein
VHDNVAALHHLFWPHVSSSPRMDDHIDLSVNLIAHFLATSQYISVRAPLPCYPDVALRPFDHRMEDSNDNVSAA